MPEPGACRRIAFRAHFEECELAVVPSEEKKRAPHPRETAGRDESRESRAAGGLGFGLASRSVVRSLLWPKLEVDRSSTDSAMVDSQEPAAGLVSGSHRILTHQLFLVCFLFGGL